MVNAFLVMTVLNRAKEITSLTQKLNFFSFCCYTKLHWVPDLKQNTSQRDFYFSILELNKIQFGLTSLVSFWKPMILVWMRHWNVNFKTLQVESTFYTAFKGEDIIGLGLMKYSIDIIIYESVWLKIGPTLDFKSKHFEIFSMHNFEKLLSKFHFKFQIYLIS